MKKLLQILLLIITTSSYAQTAGDHVTFKKAVGAGDVKLYSAPINNTFWGTGPAGAYTQYTANTASALLDGATDPFLRTSAVGAGGITQLTTDVTAGPGSGSQAATISNDAVTNAKAANMVQATIKGRAAGAGTGDPTDLTPNQASTILDGATDPFLRTSAAAGYVTSVGGTSPISSTGGATPAISIANAAADGATKGAASFAAVDFDAASGNITIDYVNTQKATGAQPGALAAADWTTFNDKAPTASPTFTGVPIAPTAAQGTNTTQLATTAFVQQDAIVKTFVAAKGDLIGASANDTPAITTVGTDGQLLMANSANASGLGYAWKTFTQPWFRASTTITNIPAAITWFPGGTGTTRQQPYSLAGYTQIKIDVFVTTIFTGAGSGVLFRYRTAYSATETDYLSIGAGATDCKAAISAADWNTSGWIDITALALADVYVGVFTINGNGTSDPVVSQVILYLR